MLGKVTHSAYELTTIRYALYLPREPLAGNEFTFEYFVFDQLRMQTGDCTLAPTATTSQRFSKGVLAKVVGDRHIRGSSRA